MTDLTPGSNTALPAAARFEVAVSYERQHADVICLLLDANGRADGDNGVALFSQPTCAGGAVRVDAEADRVAVDVSALPAAIERVLVVANADTCPTIDGAGPVRAAVHADGAVVAQAAFPSPPAVATMQLVELYRRNGAWKVRSLGDGYADGLAKLLTVHGVEVTDDGSSDAAAAPASPAPPAAVPPSPSAPSAPAAGPPIDLTKPDLPASGAVSLKKGEGVTLRKGGQTLTKVVMGLGWDPAASGRSIDLDASCVMLDATANKVEAVSFMHLKSKGNVVVHSGDNLTGEGDGDDETITVDLARVPANVQMLAFTVNSFAGHNFSQVSNAFCRLLDDSGTERVRYNLSESGRGNFGKHRGVVMATVERAGDTWTLTARGDFGDGRTYKGLMDIIRSYFGAAVASGGRRKLFGR